MSGTYPTASYLFRIGKVKSSVCPYCTMGIVETLGHFACVCPRFREARTAAHNQAWSVISSFIASRAGKDWKFQWDTQMKWTGLVLSSDQLEEFRQGEAPSEQSLKKVCVSNLRPDGIAVSEASKQIAILEFCRPSDTCPDQLKAAYDRKNIKYAVLVDAL